MSIDMDDIPIMPFNPPNDYIVYDCIYDVDDKLNIKYNNVEIDNAINVNLEDYNIEEHNHQFFDDASKAWRYNKVKAKNKYWRYGCIKIKSNKTLCKRILVYPDAKYCKYHFKQRKWTGQSY